MWFWMAVEYLLFDGLEVVLEALVLARQTAHRLQVLAVVFGVEGGLLLVDPGHRFVGVAVEDVHQFGARQRLLARVRQLVQVVPQLVDVVHLDPKKSISER